MRMPVYLAGALVVAAVSALLSSVLGIGAANVYVGSRQPSAGARATPAPASASTPSQFAVYVPPSPAAAATPNAEPQAPPVQQAPPPAGGGGGDHGGHGGGHHH